jgi:hypothetical protein
MSEKEKDQEKKTEPEASESAAHAIEQDETHINNEEDDGPATER